MHLQWNARWVLEPWIQGNFRKANPHYGYLPQICKLEQDAKELLLAEALWLALPLKHKWTINNTSSSEF